METPIKVQEALRAVELAAKTARKAGKLHTKAPTDATETAVHEAYDALQRAAARAKDAMPVYSRVLREAMRNRSCRFGVDKYVEIAIIEDANRRGGFHFFGAEELRFFGSRLPSHGYQGTHEVYFVTSEKRPRSDDPRGWTVRVIFADGSTGTIGRFQEYGSSKAADRAAQKCAEESRAAGRPLGQDRDRV